MAVKLTSYLFRNRFHRFYFRRAIPPDLLPYFCRRTLYKSLATCEQREAVRRVAYYIALTEQSFERIRQSMKNKDDDLICVELKMILELEDLGKVTLEMEPHEVDVGKQLLETTIAAARARMAVGASTSATTFARLPLSIVIDKYCRENESAGIWSTASAKDYRGDFRQFTEIIGDGAISDITQERVVTTKDTWLKLPPNLKKTANLSGKTIDEVLQLGLSPQSAANVSKKWERVRTFFAWAHANSYVTANYAAKLKIKSKGKSYEPFTPTDLDVLFCSVEYKNGKFNEPLKYWIPLIGLFTGARLEEIAQLHVMDIKLHSQSYFFHITEVDNGVDGSVGPKKRLKNDSSDRVCPIHPELVELGFLNFVAERKERGDDRLFPELRHDSGEKVGARASEWFTKYRRAKGVGQAVGRSTKVFHSFRHTMNTELQSLDVSQEIRERLCGHKSQSINVSVYGGKYLDEQLVKAIEKLDYHVEFTAYKAINRKSAKRNRGT